MKETTTALDRIGLVRKDFNFSRHFSKNIFLFLLLNFGANLLFAQGENDNWYFGNQAAVNFSTSIPVALSSSAMNTLEGCGSVSDSNGNLLFYVSPQNIWNRQNQVMPNGTLVSYLDTSEQIAIVKNPANDNQYYVFTTGVNGLNNSNYRISYSIVDMTLGSIGTNGNPLGDVLYRFKQIPVLDDAGNLFYSEAVTIVPNTDGVSFWVLIPNEKKLYAYRLDAGGFDNGNPVISDLDTPITGNHYGIKASPKVYNNVFTHYICISPWFDTITGWGLPDSYFTNQVYSFDASVGKITPDFSLQANALRAYSPEFNKDASVLFLGARDIYAVDLINSTSSSVQSMMVYDDPLPYSSGEGMAIQRNKQGDIYASVNYKLYLAQITNPDIYGLGIGIDLNAIYLNGASTNYGLPQLVPSLDESEGYHSCMDDLILTHENNLSFYYEIAKTIKTQDHYTLGLNHDITMQAGININLLPGTDIQYGANYSAFIAPCAKIKSKISKPNQKGMLLMLDQEERNQRAKMKNIEIFPNPVSDVLTVKADLKIENVSVNDISGKNINVNLRDNKVDVRNLPSGSYIITIETKEGKTTKKFIKK